MSLANDAEIAADLPEDRRRLIEAQWGEASRALSPRGLDNWLKGASALQRIGRGGDIVTAWIEKAPEVAREAGEDVIADFAQHCLHFASRTSGAVIVLIISTAPTAARRLGDAELFGAYLQLLNDLLGQAPRALRPMLERLDQLLGVLTLGGLRRWALWGAQAHRNDFDQQLRYFSLQSEEAKALLQKERKGTLFADVHRRIAMYLRALWGRDFFLRPTAGDLDARAGIKPFISDWFIHLPDAYDDWEDTAGIDLYRAAAAHCAAHLAAPRKHIDADRLDVLQQACVGLFEDARVEALAIRRFPRVKALWVRFHRAGPRGDAVGAYLDRIAHALLDPDRVDNDPLIGWARESFTAAELEDSAAPLQLGLDLAAEFRRRALPFPSQRDGQSPPYRDDNRYLWEYEEYSYDQAIARGWEPRQQVRKYVSVSEMVNQVEVETAGDDAQEIWVCASEFFDDDGASFNQREGREPVAEPSHYEEFDYHIQLSRPAWTTVLEKRPKLGDLAVVEGIIDSHRRITQRLKHRLDALQPQGMQRIRKLEEGDEVDVDAALRSLVDIRLGSSPDPRVMMRSLRRTRDIAVLVLLDLSESTNDKLAGRDATVLDLTRAATVLLAEAIHKVGDAFALHGFNSDGRHNIFYQRCKDFDQPWNDVAKARLAGMEGRFSTRMGAAIRHAGRQLSRVRGAKKLLLVVTDGEPADIDVGDPQYLRFDAKKAVEDIGRQGVVPFCLTLDPRADQYVARIFGQRNYLILDHIERLPERLPQLYAGLTR